MSAPFVHLSVRSNYSLREGAIRLDELAARTRALGMHAVALTDRDSLAGAVRFTQACKTYGVRPIYGTRLTVGDAASENHSVVTLLAKDARGYENLCRIVTAAHFNGERGDPCVSQEHLREHTESLFVLLGPESDVGKALHSRRDEEARSGVRRWLELFGFPNTVVEVRRWLQQGDRGVVGRAIAFADEVGLRSCATNGARVLTRADAFLCDVLDAMRKLVPLADHHRDNTNDEAYIKSPEEMAQLFPSRLLTESYRIAEECRFELELGKLHLPRYPANPDRSRFTGRQIASDRSALVPDGLPQRSLNELLAKRCFDGLPRRGMRYEGKTKRILDAELQMSTKLGFAGYFLTVADIVARTKSRGVRVACRGSAAGSLVCFLTGISEVDPVEHDLVFERFMNPTRTNELPDIDLDVESARREEVYTDILGHFDSERVACVAMVDTYRARGAIREVGKALALPEGELDLVAKSFPHISASGIRSALEHLPELKRSSLNRGQMEMLFGVAERLDAFPRHLALHPSGILIAPDDLLRVTAMERSANGFRMSQFDKDDVEALGLLKLDVIGIRMLSSMTLAQREIARIESIDVDLDRIPRDDEKTFELIRASRTLGCFQIESPGQRELLQKMQPVKWKDLIVDISLFRPGPVQSDMINPFLNRRGGWAKPLYSHPALRDFMQETFGVIVYHEQVMRAIAAVTGCDLGAADEVRRALVDKDAHDDIRRWFTRCGRLNGWRDPEIEPVWREVASFAAFGFCKAHAAAFAVPTYQSAWLKAHHPAAFFAGILTHEPGMYPRRALLDDARHEGVGILPLDVNTSMKTYTVERMEVAEAPGNIQKQQALGVRIGLMHVEGISEKEIDSILVARAKRAFSGLADFCRRTKVSRPVVEGLIHTGAFDAFGGRRDQLLAVGEFWDRKQPKPEPKQQELTVAEHGKAWGLRPYTDAEKVRAELEVTGMDTSKHIISFYGRVLNALGAMPSSDLKNKTRNNQRVMIAGVKVASQTPAVRSGQRIIFLTLDDGTGLSDATVFESVQEQCAFTVFHSWLLVVRGTVRRTGRAGISINAERAWDLLELARDHEAGALDIDALWSEGVEEIEAAERERVRNRGKRTPPPADPQPAEAIPLRARERSRTALEAPRKLWHASGGSAG